MFHARSGADDLQFQHFLCVLGGGAIGVGRLHEADVELALQPGGSSQVDDEDGAERSDAIAVQEMKDLVFVGVVVDDTVGITVKGGAAFVWAGVRFGGSTLFGFDIVGAALDSISSYPDCMWFNSPRSSKPLVGWCRR